MKTTIYKSGTRGTADHGWLKSYHTFSFAGYYDPSRVHFGMLRVLNDDSVAAGMGFGTHPHDNMEIVSIPLSGALEHKDSMGTSSVIRPGEVQIMSAGTGVEHSEFNHSKTEEVKFLQIWVFPREKNIQPRYDQKSFPAEARINTLQVVVSPEKSDNTIWINQDAWFSLGSLKTGTEVDYTIRKTGNGVFVFLLEGSLIVTGTELDRRDGLGISEAESFRIKASKDSEVLIMEIPMQ